MFIYFVHSSTRSERKSLLSLRPSHTAHRVPLSISRLVCYPHLLYPPNAAGELSIDVHGARSSPFNVKRKIRHSSRYLAALISPPVIYEANVNSSRMNRGCRAVRSRVKVFIYVIFCLHAPRTRYLAESKVYVDAAA